MLLFASIRITVTFTCQNTHNDGQFGVLVTLMVNFIETGTESFCITCRLVAYSHSVLGSFGN